MGERGQDPYSDLYLLSHPTSRRHPRMEQTKRAAQFSPFAALTGYEEQIEQTAAQSQENALAEVSYEPITEDI